MNVTAIVLTAGLSRRMGEQKLLLPIDGVPMVQHTLDLIAILPFSKRILVTVPEIAEAVQTEAEIVFNQRPELGQSLSVRLGVFAAPVSDSLLFLTGDQPLLDAPTIHAILAADDGESIVYPIDVDGQPKSPTLFAPRFREALLALQGDAGGRQIRQQFPEACREVQIENAAALLDVDTPAEYEKIKKARERR